MKLLMFVMVLNVGGGAGCRRVINRDLIVGEYRANHNRGLDTLELKASGTYLYRYDGVDGRHVVNTNEWKFMNDRGRPLIACFGFVFGLPEYNGTSGRPGTWLVEVSRPLFGGPLRLKLDPDRDYYYIKQTRSVATASELGSPAKQP